MVKTNKNLQSLKVVDRKNQEKGLLPWLVVRVKELRPPERVDRDKHRQTLRMQMEQD